MNRFVRSRDSSRLCVFAGLLVLLTWCPAMVTAGTYGGGSGTADDPFLIQTAEQFAAIGETPEDWGRRFKLTNDIDLSGYDQTNLHPIGRWVVAGWNENASFSGRFDGNGKTIRGFQLKDMESQYVGLFQYVTGQIVNLRVADARLSANGVGVGAMIGYLEKGAVSDCSAVQVTVSGNEGAGALIGVVDGTLYASWSSGSVSGVRYAGGLVGRVGGGRVTRSYSKASVVGREAVGGLVGGTTKGTSIVDYCYAVGPVDGDTGVGGLIGHVGGVVAWCYSAGKVTGEQSVGGLVAHQYALADVHSSLWDMETSGQTTSAGGTGKSTAEMKSIDTYLPVNFDFGGMWTICEGRAYPILLWQIPPGDLRCPDGVNFTDFVWFAAAWRHADCGELNYSCEGADLDKSGDVDPLDLAIFSANWLVGVEW